MKILGKLSIQGISTMLSGIGDSDGTEASGWHYETEVTEGRVARHDWTVKARGPGRRMC